MIILGTMSKLMVNPVQWSMDNHCVLRAWKTFKVNPRGQTYVFKIKIAWNPILGSKQSIIDPTQYWFFQKTVSGQKNCRKIRHFVDFCIFMPIYIFLHVTFHFWKLGVLGLEKAFVAIIAIKQTLILNCLNFHYLL